MKCPGFGLLWVLAFSVPIKAKVNFVSNSTRVTNGRLWTMADNINDIHNFIFEKLRGFAMDCCTNTLYGHGLSNCDKKQVAYWADVDKRVWDGKPDQKKDLEVWFDDFYNPAEIAKVDLEYAGWLCKGTGNDNDVLPSFAQVIYTKPPSDEGHTEAQLIKRMTRKAQMLATEGYPANFFLFTSNSPCGSPFAKNCQKKIFKLAYDEMYVNSQKYHSLAVGLYQWWRPKGSSVEEARRKFCEDITNEKKSSEYNSVDFFNGLFFKKIMREEDDATYNPGNGNC